MIPGTVAEERWVASGACSSCPHRGTCHESRQRIQDAEHALGRHYACPFYQSIELSLRQGPRVARPVWRYLLGGDR